MSPPLEKHDYVGLSEVSSDTLNNFRQTELRLGLPGSDPLQEVNDTGLTLGINLKGFGSGSKRGFSDAINGSSKWGFSKGSEVELFSPKKGEGGFGVKDEEKKMVGNLAPAAKAQVVGWPPIRNSRKNILATGNSQSKNKEEADGKQGLGCLYVKVSMDGAPYLRKVDLKTYSNYIQFSSALEKMFSCFTIDQYGSHGIPTRDGLSDGSENVLTYEDKDGDWMLVGDVPWDMFVVTCNRLRIMKGSDVIGLAPRAMEKNKNRT